MLYKLAQVSALLHHLVGLYVRESKKKKKKGQENENRRVKCYKWSKNCKWGGRERLEACKSGSL
jgi:hypothetical protein